MSEFAAYAPRPAGTDASPRLEGLIVRPAAERDVGAIAAIAAAREGEEVALWRARARRLVGAGRRADRSMLLVAELPAPTGIVGYGKAAFHARPPDAPPNAAPEGWYLTGVVVRPEFRRRGAGSALTRARLERIAPKSPHAYYVASAMNPATVDLHRGFGFVEITREFLLPGVTFTGGVGILFRRDLAALAAGPVERAGR